MTTPVTVRPDSVGEAVEAVRALSAAGGPAHPVGTASRQGWGGGDPAGSVALDTTGLSRIVEHDAGDFTAVLQAGVRLADAQAAFAPAGQWLAVDAPPHPSRGTGTIGGLIATADSGPSRHRYGGIRDLVIGATVLLSDATLARSGGKVIKNVAGYDLGKLFTGSYGTLGLVVEVAVRLHPVPRSTATVVADEPDPARLVPVALALARRVGDAACLDLAFSGGAGRLLMRFAGHAAAARARDAAAGCGLDKVRVEEDDGPLWTIQSGYQRADGGAVVKVSARPTDLSTVVAATAGCGGSLVSRVALGLSWLRLPPSPDLTEQIRSVRVALAPRACTVLDGGELVAQPWPELAAPALAVMRRVKERFDPARLFRPGTFAGGI